MSERHVWRYLADLMIPPDMDRGLLPGSSVDVSAVIKSDAERQAFDASVDRVAELAEMAMGATLENISDTLFQDFLARDRVELNPHLRIIGAVLLKAYYTDPRIRDALGVGAEAPFPSGSRVYSGNLELLEPVYKRGKIYRSIDFEC